MTELDHGGTSAQRPDPDPALFLRRRTLLRRAVAGAAVLGLGGVTVSQGLGYDLPAEVRGGLLALSAKEFLVLEAACRRLLDGLDPAAPREAAVWADGYLARQAPWVRSDVRLLLHAFEHSPPALLGALSRFTRLDPARQDRHLNAWRMSGLPPLKQGFTALKGLAFMGAYRRSATLLAIGYDGPAGA
ncbi:MAG: hypothetical protein M9894_26965 [Planctomycetes bacterium]|nr:hypothetical protein [Planctomycetota bacterium]